MKYLNEILEPINMLSMLLLVLTLLQALALGTMYLRKANKQKKLSFSARILLEEYVDLVFPYESYNKISPSDFALGFKNQAIELKSAFIDCLTFLNRMEFLGCMLKNEVIDRGFAREFMGSFLVLSFEKFIPHIIAAREATQNPDIFTSIEYIHGIWVREYDK